MNYFERGRPVLLAILLGLSFATIPAVAKDTQADPAIDLNVSEGLPEVIEAQADPLDPWYPYKTRPIKDSEAATSRYPKDLLDNLAKLTHTNPQLVPWSLKGIPTGEKNLYSLGDIISDKIVDKETGKVYSLMYHGTTSDLVDVFKAGAKTIRFDVATHTVLGMGFYLAASLNEAKAYACDRLKQRKKDVKDLKGLILVVGVEDNPIIKGKPSPNAQLSNDKTGDPLDKDIFFKRNINLKNPNDNRYNQFSFFSNVAPYLKIFYIVVLPKGFGRTNWVQDFDGQIDAPNAPYKTNPAFRCDA